ncbi:hypothetical protein BDP81DRAFT_440239 [Colletotrichum phormii]|uniref:Uncharacterized protein n=1 Tax=Colletotrichum phormii TaxID=359342 RepID=A0AAJ0E9S2_9PEZI|nr:uncharacterized protein BDP81DRAFT_440239 [Colletotrichum phormii]KAK1623130.1 hypothetical protein BDP81DRAFT_440239 [Colletotrichum phormii]
MGLNLYRYGYRRPHTPMAVRNQDRDWRNHRRTLTCASRGFPENQCLCLRLRERGRDGHQPPAKSPAGRGNVNVVDGIGDCQDWA